MYPEQSVRFVVFIYKMRPVSTPISQSICGEKCLKSALDNTCLVQGKYGLLTKTASVQFLSESVIIKAQAFSHSLVYR